MVEGKEIGNQFAMVLALSAAFLHAVFGALQKFNTIPGCHAVRLISAIL